MHSNFSLALISLKNMHLLKLLKNVRFSINVVKKKGFQKNL